MKFSVNREEILQPLGLANGVVQSKQTKPILGNLLLRANNGELTITATDTEIQFLTSIAVNVEQPGEITIPAKKFFDICRSLSAHALVDINVEGDNATVRSGNASFTLTTLPAQEYPELIAFNHGESFNLVEKDLRRVIDKTAFAMGVKHVRTFLNGLLFEFTPGYLRLVASDGHRLAISELESEHIRVERLRPVVPRKAVQEILRLLDASSTDQIELIVSDAHILLRKGQTEFVSKLINAEYLEYRGFIPLETQHHITVNRDELKQALGRVILLCNMQNFGAIFNFENDSLTVTASNQDREEAIEKLTTEYQGAEVSSGYNIQYVADALSALDTQEVTFNLVTDTRHALITAQSDPQTKHFVLPMIV